VTSAVSVTILPSKQGHH